MKNKILSSTGLLIALGLLLGINLIAGLFVKNVKLDLTENQLYTLSKGTENILSDLAQPVKLQLYFSEKYFTGLPGVQNYGARVKDLLEQYVALSNGKLSLVVADPEPFSETEDEAVKYGLQGVPVDSTGNQAYFGLVGLGQDTKKEVIPFLQPDKEASLEYDVTRLIYSLATSKRTTVGLMTGLPMEGMPMNPFMPQAQGGQGWFIVKQLKKSFNVRSLSMDISEIPKDINVLMLVHPKDISDKAMFAIDQFVLGGGRLMAFVDPFSEADQPAGNPGNPMAAMQSKRSSDLKPLFDRWGVELVENKIATDKTNAQRVQVQSAGRVKAVEYVAWLSFDKEDLNRSDFVTRDLEKLSIATPGYFKRKPEIAVDFMPLVSTSKNAMVFENTQFQFGANPEQLLRKFEPSGEAYPLVLRLSGLVKTAFSDGVTYEKPAESDDKDAKPTKETLKPDHLEGSINVILVADTDLLDDKHWVRIQNFFGNQIAMPHANNDAFVLNAIENLGGSNDLISLRSRSKSTREFTKVVEIKNEAEKRFRDQERSLQTKLEETEKKLAQLQQQKGGAGSTILTAEQQQEIEDFRAEQVQTRKALRNVQHELVKSIESLGTTLKALNTGLMPLLVIIFAIVFLTRRKKQMAM